MQSPARQHDYSTDSPSASSSSGPQSVLRLFFFNDPATTEIYTLSLHDALPISTFLLYLSEDGPVLVHAGTGAFLRSEEHTSELQSHSDLVCRLLLEKKNSWGGRRAIFNPTRTCCTNRPRSPPSSCLISCAASTA